MNKLIIGAGCVALTACMASCLKNDDTSTSSLTVQYKPYTLVSHIGGAADPEISSPTYNITVNGAGKAVVVAEGLMIGGVATGIKTQEMPYGVGSNGMYELISGDQGNVSATSDDITGFRAEITRFAATNYVDIMRPLSAVLNNDPISRPAPTDRGVTSYLFMQFVYDRQWQVNTFWSDMLFKGTTRTSWGAGEDQKYENSDFTYRIKMNIGTDNKYTADVYFYNAKFAEMAPAVNFVLKGLTLKFRTGGYEITGTDVEPVMIPENTPNPRYTFQSLNIRSAEDMTAIQAAFTVGQSYSGSFSGNSVYLSKYAK